jgi:HK97 gp10 family phage protein
LQGVNLVPVVGKIEVKGLAELHNRLKQLPAKIAVKVLRGALKEAAMPILHAARSKAPVDTGLLVSTIRTSAFMSKRKSLVGVRVGTRAGDYKGESFYASFIEFGFHRGKRTKWVRKPKGRARKIASAVAGALNSLRPFVPAQPFLRNAFDENKEAALSIFKTALAAGIDKVAKEKA